MTVINTNILSQIAQNNLNNTQSSLTQAITQLSSGLKINSAADDPAGLAIAGRLEAQINGQTTAQSNANGGISLAQTAQSALNQITNNLQTIRQLAVQASNATYSAADRASLNQEVQQSLAQINTIASTTQYNGQSLLDGTFGTQNFQIGANAGQNISVNLSAGAKTSQIGQVSTTSFSLQGTNGGLSTETLNIAVGGSPAVTVSNAVAGTAPGQSADSAYAAAQAISNANISGLTASASNTQTFTYTNIASAATATGPEVFNLTINGVNVFGQSGLSLAAGTSTSAASLLNSINGVSSQTGVTATLAADGKTFTLSAADGRNIAVSQNTTGADVSGGLDNTATKYNGVGGTLNALTASATGSSASTGQLHGTVTLSSSSTITLSGKAADDIAKQVDNVTNNADSLQSTQTITSTTAFATGTAGGTIAFSLNGASVGTVTVSTTDTAATTAQAINNSAGLQAAGITASVNAQGKLVVSNTSGQSLAIVDANQGAGTGFNSGLDNATVFTAGAAYTAPTAAGTITFSLGGTAVGTVNIAASATVNAAAAAINNNAAVKAAGLVATVSAGKLVITNTSGQALTVADGGNGGTAFSGLPTGTVTAGTYESPNANSTYAAAQTGSLASIDVLSVADAQHAIQAVDAALSQVSALNGQLGAVQNRFSSTISNLTASTQNATSTKSTIQDADYASAAAQLSRAQVMSQAATAMVAQANQIPQQVLKLLQ